MKAAIVSSSDCNYFHLLMDLLQSLRALPESRGIDVCVLDVGLTKEQVDELTPLVARVAAARWDVDFPGREMCPGWFRAMTARPFLPSYFPDYELLIWIDADAWLCNWDAMRLLLHAGQRDGFAIIPELDRCYPRSYHAEPNITQALHTAYTQCFGAEAAEKYSLRPQANCGVFAMQSASPNWSIWANLMTQGLNRSIQRMAEQCALNIAIYSGRIRAAFLPSWCNWIVAASVPMLNKEKAQLVAPMLPHERISICHLVDVKDQLLNVTCTDGSTRRIPLTFRAVRSANGDADNQRENNLRDSGRLDEFIASYRRAVQLSPDKANLHVNLANALRNAGKPDEAIEHYRIALRLDPADPATYNNLACALQDKELLDEAVELFQKAADLMPDWAEGHCNLGMAQRRIGRLEQAIAAYRKAIALKPDYAQAHAHLAEALREAGQLSAAVAEYQQAIRINPNFAEAHCDLGLAYKEQDQPDEAIAALREAWRLKPDSAQIALNLANAMSYVSRLDESLEYMDRAIALRPRDAKYHSAKLFSMMFHPRYDSPALLRACREFDRIHAEPLRGSILPHANKRDPNRRLRIGYVSPDFKTHCQALVTLPVLKAHDRDQAEVYCYGNVARPDAVTDQFRQCADAWRDISSLSDEQAAEQVRRDQIDILIDLTMHMKDNRLLLFARKPAPVQVNWAYPGTTGLTAMDYRLTDPYLDPPGTADADYSERSIRLPDCFWCYDMMQGDVTVNPLPALSNGYITFGCLNNPIKLNAGVLNAWAAVMRAVPKSRLLLLFPPGQARQRVLTVFSANGVASDRIDFVPYQSRKSYLETYHRIDIGLDTFPYNGHNTSADSLWMGVPVLSLLGKTVMGRAGLCELTHVGLPHWLATDMNQFIAKAQQFADDLSGLSHCRQTLRERMESSPLMQPRKFARSMEDAFREMWRKWCGS